VECQRLCLNRRLQHHLFALLSRFFDCVSLVMIVRRVLGRKARDDKRCLVRGVSSKTNTVPYSLKK
jgi:hypothetical protein